jgi:hypothetical protein
MAVVHMSSRTPLRGVHHRSTSSLSLPFTTVLAGLNPTRKKSRNRTTLLALFALLSLSAYVFCIHYPTLLSPAYRLRTAAADSSATAEAVLESPRNSHLSTNKKHKPLGRPLITLSPAQELAAVSSFLASLPQNVIPLSVDPSLPIDPDLVLDFDTRSPHAMEEVERVVEDVWSQNPVMIYGKVCFFVLCS